MMVAGEFIPWLRIRERVIASLRNAVKYLLYPGHKCPGYHHTPLWGENNDQATF